MSNSAGPGSSLSAKQRAFVDAYLLTKNATEAARQAGYAHPNSQGPRLLLNVRVKAAIATALDQATERASVTLDWVIAQLAVEATREGEGASHSGRIAALRELRQHLADNRGGGASEVADALKEIAGKLPG